MAGNGDKEKAKMDSDFSAYDQAEFTDVIERLDQLTDDLQDQLQVRVRVLISASFRTLLL